jgi:hypothetical protein
VVLGVGCVGGVLVYGCGYSVVVVIEVLMFVVGCCFLWFCVCCGF